MEQLAKGRYRHRGYDIMRVARGWKITGVDGSAGPIVRTLYAARDWIDEDRIEIMKQWEEEIVK